MEFLTKISDMLGIGQKSHGLDLTPEIERFGLHRRSRASLSDADLFRGYATHELVYACINKIADVMNDAEIIVEKRNGKGEWKKVEGHPLANLLKKPNQNETGRDFRRLMVQSEQALGIFYGELIRSKAGIVAEIHPLNPNRIQPRLDKQRESIAYYEYTSANGKKHEIKPENMLVRRRVDLVNRFYGLSPLAVALKSVNSDIGMTDYIDAFFESDGTPSGILKILNATVSDAKKQAMQAQWQRKYSRWGTNRKGVAVLDQQAEFQKIGSNLDELSSDALTGRFESRICAVFGVPPNLVGAYVGLLHVTANATAKAELRNFWDNKISGELSQLREWLTWYVLPEYENIDTIRSEKIRVGFDIKHVAFLQEDLNEIHERARENFKAGGWTLNEFRTATGMMPDKAGDYYIQPMSLDVITPDNRAEEAAMVRVPKDNVTPPQLTAGDGESDEDDTDDTDDEKAANPAPTEKKTVENVKAYDWNGLTLGREPSELEQIIDLKTIVADFETEKERAAAVLLRFRDGLIDQAAMRIAELTPETVYTLTLAPTPKIRQQMAKILRSSFDRGRAQVRAEIAAQTAAKSTHGALEAKDLDDGEFDDEYFDEMVSIILAKVINEIQSRAINIYVAMQALLDFTIDALRDSLRDESTKFIEQTAANVVNSVMQNGRNEEITTRLSADADKYKYCEYSAVLDKNTCGPCRDADGKQAPTPDDLPAAPNPDCDGSWNCRCFVVLVSADEA